MAGTRDCIVVGGYNFDIARAIGPLRRDFKNDSITLDYINHLYVNNVERRG